MNELKVKSKKTKAKSKETVGPIISPPKYLYYLFFIFTFYFLLTAPSASAQRRDYMTDQEVEVIRDAQDLDVRIGVLIKMIDRRFNALGIEVGGWKGGGKNAGDWGPEPTGERRELFDDIRKLLQKAVDDINNAAEFPNSAPVRDMSNPDDKRAAKDDPHRFGKAVHLLAQAAGRYQTPLKNALPTIKDEKDKGAVYDALDSCNEIIASANKTPADLPKKP